MNSSETSMASCNCMGTTQLLKYQFISDALIAMAYFSIPMELLYFMRKSIFFPYRWVLLLFGSFIVLCGATHLINLWSFAMHSRTVDLAMTAAKLACAVVSCATALILIRIIPQVLNMKSPELLLKINKNEAFDGKIGV